MIQPVSQTYFLYKARRWIQPSRSSPTPLPSASSPLYPSSRFSLPRFLSPSSSPSPSFLFPLLILSLLPILSSPRTHNHTKSVCAHSLSLSLSLSFFFFRPPNYLYSSGHSTSTFQQMDALRSKHARRLNSDTTSTVTGLNHIPEPKWSRDGRKSRTADEGECVSETHRTCHRKYYDEFYTEFPLLTVRRAYILSLSCVSFYHSHSRALITVLSRLPGSKLPTLGHRSELRHRVFRLDFHRESAVSLLMCEISSLSFQNLTTILFLFPSRLLSSIKSFSNGKTV